MELPMVVFNASRAEGVAQRSGVRNSNMEAGAELVAVRFASEVKRY